MGALGGAAGARLPGGPRTDGAAVAAPLHHRAPRSRAQTRHLTPQERIVELRRGRIDAELMFPPPREADLEHLLVLRSPRYVLMHERHPLAGERAVDYAQIAHERVPARHPSVPADWAQEAWLMNFRGSSPEVTKERPTSADEVWALVAAGKAISVLPGFVVAGAEGQGVRAVPLADVDPVDVALVRRADDTARRCSLCSQRRRRRHRGGNSLTLSDRDARAPL